MRGNPYLSRLVGSKGPLSHRWQRRQVEVKEVFIGNQPPSTRLHHAVAANKWLREEELYAPRKRLRG